MMSLLVILKSRFEFGFSVTISATRCLLNVLNQHPGRMISFASPTIDGLATLVDIILESFPCRSNNSNGDYKLSAEDKHSTNGIKDLSCDEKSSVTPSGSPDKKAARGEEKASVSYSTNVAESKTASSQESFQDSNDNSIQEIQYCIKIIYMMVCQW